jgi:hypothetical protein
MVKDSESCMIGSAGSKARRIILLFCYDFLVLKLKLLNQILDY